jgi:hypothetical protein
MRCGLILVVLTAVTCYSQTTGQAKTVGPCSPAVSGSNNQFTINCLVNTDQRT